MAVFIGGIKKQSLSRKEAEKELARLYTLAWIADSKVEYHDWGAAKNPQQQAAANRSLGRANKFAVANNINYIDADEIAKKTYRKVNKLD